MEHGEDAKLEVIFDQFQVLGGYAYRSVVKDKSRSYEVLCPLFETFK
jgi:hypothetical protein